MDCRTCEHNSYRKLERVNKEWLSCSHPVTIAKGPHWERGDPAMVNFRTGDVPMSQLSELADCPTYQAAE